MRMVVKMRMMMNTMMN